MALPITIPNTFAAATAPIPLANLDANFTTVANAINGIGNGSETLVNVSITGGSISNVTGVANASVNIIAGTGLTGGGALTANVNLAVADTAVIPATYGGGSNAAQVTVDQQGRITAAANVAIPQGTVTNVATGTGLTGGPITSTGTVSIANTTVAAGTYGNANTVSVFTVNAQGQLTSASNTAIAIGTAQVTGLGTIATQASSNVNITGGTISNTPIDFQDQLATRPTLKDYSINGEVLGLLNANTSLNFANANFFSATANANVTISFANASAANTMSGCVLALTNGGSKTLTWSNVAWSGNTAPQLTSNGLDILVFVTYDAGTTVHGMVASLNSYK
jgi:hypothetical protein